MRSVVLLLVLCAAAPAQAQREDDEVSDIELIRWAANEVRLHEHRAYVPSVPMPPDAYLGTGADGVHAMPDESERDALRVLAELGGGVLGLIVGGGLGTLVVWAALEADASPEWMLVAAAAGTTLGAMGMTTGVVLSADAAGGEGNFAYTFIGQLIGSVAALPLVVLGMHADAPAVAIVAASALPLAGAILGYEISHANRGAVAYVTPQSGGAVGGVAGALP